MPSNNLHRQHKVTLKKVSYPLISKQTSLKVPGAKKHVSGQYQINNQRLKLLPQLALIIVILSLASVIAWLFWPSSTVDKPTDLVIAQQALIDKEVMPVQLPFTEQDTPATSSTGFELKDEQNRSCSLIRSPQTPASLATTDYSRLVSGANGWWIPKEKDDCGAGLKGILVARLNEDQFNALRNKLESDTVSIQLIDGIDTYAIFFGINTKPAIKGETYLKPLTNGIITDRFYFDASRAYAQKRIDSTTYFLDGGCQAPRTPANNPCILWKMDVFSGVVTMLKKDIALTGVNQANEIKDSRFIRFSPRQDYDDGINFIFIDPGSKKTVLLRVSTQSDSYPITSEYELISGDDAYARYV